MSYDFPEYTREKGVIFAPLQYCMLGRHEFQNRTGKWGVLFYLAVSHVTDAMPRALVDTEGLHHLVAELARAALVVAEALLAGAPPTSALHQPGEAGSVE